MTLALNSRKIGLLAVVWLLAALVVLLVPAPREWGSFGDWVSPHYDRVQHYIEPTVHVVLMASICILLMFCFKEKTPLAAASYAMVFTLMLAVALEGLQSFLPAEFGRQCDFHDLLPALTGALVGCLTGLMFRKRRC